MLPYRLQPDNSTTPIINPAVPDSVANSLASEHAADENAKFRAKNYRLLSLFAQGMQSAASTLQLALTELATVQAALLIPNRSIESEYAEFLQRQTNKSSWKDWSINSLQLWYYSVFQMRNESGNSLRSMNKTLDGFQQLSKSNRTVRPEISGETASRNRFTEMQPNAEDLIRGIKPESPGNDQDELTHSQELPDGEVDEDADGTDVRDPMNSGSTETSQSSSTKPSEGSDEDSTEQPAPTLRKELVGYVQDTDSTYSHSDASTPEEQNKAEIHDEEEENTTLLLVDAARQDIATADTVHTNSVQTNSGGPEPALESQENSVRQEKGTLQESSGSSEAQSPVSASSQNPRAIDTQITEENQPEDGDSSNGPKAAGERQSVSTDEAQTRGPQSTGSTADTAESGPSEPKEEERIQGQNDDPPEHISEEAVEKSLKQPDESEPVTVESESLSDTESVKATKSGPYRGSKMGLVKGENTTQLSLMVYKVAKTESIFSMAAAPCREVMGWMPEVVLRLEFELPGFEFYCVDTDEPAGAMDDLKKAFGDISGGFVQASPEEVGQSIPKKVNLVVSWMGMQGWGIRKSWRFIKGLRRSGVRMSLFSNNPMSSNADLSAGTLNIRKSPLLFNEPTRVISKVSSDENKQMLLYSMDGLREGF